MDAIVISFYRQKMIPKKLNNVPEFKISICIGDRVKIPEIQILYSGPPHYTVYYEQRKLKEVHKLNKEEEEGDDIDFNEGENVRETKDENNYDKDFLSSLATYVLLQLGLRKPL